jgi:hypothetical protein
MLCMIAFTSPVILDPSSPSRPYWADLARASMGGRPCRQERI